MLKKILTAEQSGAAAAEAAEWLGSKDIKVLGVTSESASHPIENIFEGGKRWQAAEPGLQRIQITFPEPRSLRRVQLEFTETQRGRTQEFVLRWAGSSDAEAHEIVRQQWNFSPGGSSRESEDYRLALDGVALLEIVINPDIADGTAVASLDRLRLA